VTDAFPLLGKRALVTGAGRGIGQSLALNLLGHGADVAVAARRVESLERTLNMAKALAKHSKSAKQGGFGRVAPVVMDVASVASIRAGTAEAAEALGGLDILVNNAGVDRAAPALEVEEETWDLILDTNLKGAFFAAQAAARIMSEGPGGSILNICSSTALRGAPMAAAYGSSKAGLLGMTRALAVEWGRHFIRVNALAPGHVHTDMTEHLYLDREWRAAMLERTPIARLGHADDLSGAALFLLSNASRFVTGVCLPVDGGVLASL
jgi:NAD(P)-dependent dehydrogenase (short-subunit alcohol dehydrogenase family)